MSIYVKSLVTIPIDAFPIFRTMHYPPLWGQTEGEFFSCSSMPRNRELTRVFKDVGLVEQLGSGMSRILKAYSRDIFDISENFIKVTFEFDGKEKTSPKTSPNEMNETQFKILQMIDGRSEITQKEMAEQLGLTIRAVELSMKHMIDMKMIKREGNARKGKWLRVKK